MAAPIARHRALVDETGGSVEYACVVPLYRKVSGLGWGPDASGSRMDPRAYLLKPYRFAAGDDFLAGLLPSTRKVIPVPPGISYGETFVPEKLLLLRAGYKPVLMNAYERYQDKPIVLARAPGDAAEEALRVLISEPLDQQGARGIFQTELGISAAYSDADRMALKRCLMGAKQEG